jgi:hypothetical protein
MMMPVIEIGAIPSDVVIVQSGGMELSFETFAETAFGLRIDVNAFGDVTSIAALKVRKIATVIATVLPFRSKTTFEAAGEHLGQ